MVELKNNIFMIPVKDLLPHPQNPRKDLGDLTELAESIRKNGIMQNLTVVPSDNQSGRYKFTVIIGHRRLAAAKLAGLKEVPCAIADMDEKEQLATMLTENMQRVDLTVYEQAQGIQLMLDVGFSVQDVAEQTGFSESTIRRRTKLLSLDKEKFKKSQARQINLGDYERLFEIEDESERNRLLDMLGTSEFDTALHKAKQGQKSRKERRELIEYLNGLDNVSEGSGGNGWWEYDGFMSRKSDAERMIKPDREYRYAVETYGILLHRKRTKQEYDEYYKRTEKDEKGAQFCEEAKLINERTKALRKSFTDNPPELSSEQYGALVKEFVRRTAARTYMTLETLKGKGFDEAFESDGGVKIMLEIIQRYLDGGGSGYVNAYSRSNPRRMDTDLNAFYYLLSRIGYDMNAEEKALRDGTHEIFTKYKES